MSRIKGKTTNFAVIGKGFIYPRHEQAIESVGGKVLMTCDINPETNPTFLDWLEMYNHPSFQKVDAVVICTPNYLHSTMVKEALSRGKKVLCEKPLTLNGIEGMSGVKAVLQLRKHPILQKIRDRKNRYIKGDVRVEARMYRDEKYFNSWKGDTVKSGGILFNLGVHYIDLLIFLLGKPKEILFVKVREKKVEGIVKFKNYRGMFNISIVDSPEKQGRNLFIGDREINLSNKENLSYEDLHIDVYKDFINNRGVGARSANQSLDLIYRILKWKK